VLVEAIFAYLHVGIEPEDIADGKICPITPIPRVLVSTKQVREEVHQNNKQVREEVHQ
jgi:hypothetical protein